MSRGSVVATNPGPRGADVPCCGVRNNAGRTEARSERFAFRQVGAIFGWASDFVVPCTGLWDALGAMAASELVAAHVAFLDSATFPDSLTRTSQLSPYVEFPQQEWPKVTCRHPLR